MSNLGLYYYYDVDTIKVKKYIDIVLSNILVRKPGCYKFKQISDNELLGVVNWGAFPYPYSYRNSNEMCVFFDGYLLDSCKKNGAEYIREQFDKYGIDFIERISFFGNILIRTNFVTHIITSRHNLFDLYLYKGNKFFCVTPALKFIYPLLKRPTIRKESIIMLLSFEFILNARTLFHDINKLENRSIYTFCFKENKLQHQYYEPKNIERKIHKRIIIGEIEEKLADAIDKSTNQFRNNWELSICFSGGTDSSYLLANFIKNNIKIIPYIHFHGISNRMLDKITKLIEVFDYHYPRWRIKSIITEKKQENDEEEIYEKYFELIGLQELKRLQKDIHLVAFQKSFSQKSIFTEGTIGDSILASSKLDYLINACPRFIREILLYSKIYMPTQILFVLFKLLAFNKTPKDYYLQNYINYYVWPKEFIIKICEEIDDNP
jgi:hypothetical protein